MNSTPAYPIFPWISTDFIFRILVFCFSSYFFCRHHKYLVRLIFRIRITTSTLDLPCGLILWPNGYFTTWSTHTLALTPINNIKYFYLLVNFLFIIAWFFLVWYCGVVLLWFFLVCYWGIVFSVFAERNLNKILAIN